MRILAAFLILSLASCQSYGPTLTQIARGPAITPFSFTDLQILVMADNTERAILQRMNVDQALQYGAALGGLGLAAASAFATHGASALILAGTGAALPIMASNTRGNSALYATALLNINNMIAHYLLVQGNPPSDHLTHAGVELFRNLNLAIAMLRMGSVTLLSAVSPAQ